MERFWSKVDKSGSCWTWRGYRNRRGYGYFALEGKMGLAHRASWQLANGPIPPGMHVCHHCDNPSCVRPEHLFLGTALDNMADMRRKGRGRAASGEHHGKAKLAAADVREIRRLHSGGRRGADIARAYGVCKDTVYAILDGRTWARTETAA